MESKPSPKKFTGRNISRIILLGFLASGLGLISWLVTTREIKLPVNDFTMYWSSSKLLLSGENPYDPEGLHEYQTQASGTSTDVVLMFYPPWAHLIILPVGLIDRVIGQLFWVLIGTAIIFICADRLCFHFGGSARYRWLAWLAAFSFGPTFAALGFTGQITPFFLIGLTGFLLLIDSPDKDWLTGLLLYFTAIKPQVFYLFFILLFLWAIHRRRWVLLASFTLSLALATGFGMLFDRQIIVHFFQTLTGNTPVAWATPTIGTYLRYYLGLDGFWVQFVPAIMTGILAASYWWRKRERWDWQKVLPNILFLSLITSPYTWTYDFVALIIPLLMGFVYLLNRITGWGAIFLAGFYIFINGAYWWLHLRYTDFYFIWFAPTLFIWFIMIQLVARSTSKAR